MFQTMLETGALGLLLIAFVYFVCFVFFRKFTFDKLFKRFKKPAGIIILSIPVLVAFVGFGILGCVRYNDTQKTLEKQAETTVAADASESTSDEVSPTQIETYDISFPHSLIHMKSSKDVKSLTDDDSLMELDDGFVLLSGMKYNGDIDSLFSVVKEHVFSVGNGRDFTVSSDIITPQKGSLTIKRGDQNAIVEGYSFSGICNVKEYDAPLAVSGFCLYDEKSEMVYTMTGFIENGTSAENTAAIQYLISQYLSSIEIVDE